MKLLTIFIFLFATSATAHAAPDPLAIIDGRGVTTLSWQQPSAAQVCIYDEVLLFCAQYGTGPQRVVLGRCGPCVAHVRAGDTLVLREVGGASVRVQVVRRWDVWMPWIRR